MSDSRPIGLVIPTRWEAKDVLHRFEGQRVSRAFYRAQIHERPVFICLSGVGRQAAKDASEKLLASGAKILVSMGFCGALVPDLHAGDLVTDRLITVDQPAQTAAQRRVLTQRANAVAVDMETQAVVETGTRRGVPIYILRVISDEMEDDLTPLLGKEGEFSAIKIAVRLLNPNVWPLAMKLRKQSQLAGVRLADALDSFCSAPLR